MHAGFLSQEYFRKDLQYCTLWLQAIMPLTLFPEHGWLCVLTPVLPLLGRILPARTSPASCIQPLISWRSALPKYHGAHLLLDRGCGRLRHLRSVAIGRPWGVSLKRSLC